MDIVKWVFSFIGHLALWFVTYNHVHATAWPRRRRKIFEKFVILTILLPTIWVLVTLIGRRTFSFESVYSSSRIAYFYGWACIFLGCFFVCRWVFRKMFERLPSSVVSQSQDLIDVAEKTSKNLFVGKFPNLLSKFPNNQAGMIALEHKTIELENFPKKLDGLKVCQLSDLHFTGQIIPEFFEEVVAQANRFAPDVIVLTGDIVDHDECLDWIPKILGKLTARHGKFYVLGNHDRRIKDANEIHNRMKGIGFSAVGGCWEVCTINGINISLAGNELPWYQGAENLPLAPPEESGFKFLLSHSPDQMSWAKPFKFNIMFAGHTHGGQIRLPVIGPLVAPSKHGVKYCAGTFQIGEMLLHVSRGLSGDDPIRLQCPPELGLFTFNAKSNSA